MLQQRILWFISLHLNELSMWRIWLQLPFPLLLYSLSSRYFMPKILSNYSIFQICIVVTEVFAAAINSTLSIRSYINLKRKKLFAKLYRAQIPKHNISKKCAFASNKTWFLIFGLRDRFRCRSSGKWSKTSEASRSTWTKSMQNYPQARIQHPLLLESILFIGRVAQQW